MLSILWAPHLHASEQDYDDAKQKIQEVKITDPSLPTALPADERKWSIGYIISKMFDGNGQISNWFLKVLGTRSDWAVLRWSWADDWQLVSGSIFDTGTTISTTSDLNITNWSVNIATPNDASLSSTANALTIWDRSAANIAIDGNEIMARNNGAASALYINYDGGTTRLGWSLQHYSDLHNWDFYIRDTDKWSVSNPIWYDYSSGRTYLWNTWWSSTNAEVTIRWKWQLDVEGTAVNHLVTKGYVDTAVGSIGSAVAIDDLTDAKKSGSSLFLGNDAGAVDDGANANIGIGGFALNKNVSTINNIGIWYASLRDNIWNNNVAIWRSAAILNTTGSNNVALGSYTLDASTTVSNTTAIWYAALTNNTTGANNTALGYVALAANTTWNNNTAIWLASLDSNTSWGQNTAVWLLSLSLNTTGIDNTSLWYNSLASNTTANYNTAIWSRTLDENTTGIYNTALGYNALSANTIANRNIAIGGLSLDANTTGDNNIALGYAALSASTTASDNVIIGAYAGDSITTGIRNTGVWRSSFWRLTTWVNNTALWIFSLDALTTGNDNTAVGYDALGVLTTGNNNIAIGDNAGDNITTGSSNVVIGANVDAPSATENNQININNLIYARSGNVGIGTNNPQAPLEVAAGEIRFPWAGWGFTHFNFGGSANYIRWTTLIADTWWNVGIGTASPNAWLKLHVAWKVGAAEYCDENGNNCTWSANLGGTSITPGWPDAIKCMNNAGTAGVVLWADYFPYPGWRYLYRTPASWNVYITVEFNSDKTYRSRSTSYTETCNNKTINQLYADGQAFNLAN